MSIEEEAVSTTAEKQSAIAANIINAFERFNDAYDRYCDEMDGLVGSTGWNTLLFKKSRFLILGLDDVALFMRDAKDVVNHQVAPFLHKS